MCLLEEYPAGRIFSDSQMSSHCRVYITEHEINQKKLHIRICLSLVGMGWREGWVSCCGGAVNKIINNYEFMIFHIHISYIHFIHFICIINNRWFHRGYYMAARGYEFYLRVVKVSLTRSLRSLVRDTFSTRR